MCAKNYVKDFICVIIVSHELESITLILQKGKLSSLAEIQAWMCLTS
jgi:hypothetical protein